ncbi:MAG: TetR/AcrR family transcriptional regulator C-terminal domain-containing protein [Clostridia bacterium]|nr:TetR/AcrR family transcriptional regulator C-terminal domain-containing protein [Clostridia bacterium]MDE7078868.1 TetR/AcrR family transcriptional regulator C-terminal domain-containing protein [Clostridia bacterium]
MQETRRVRMTKKMIKDAYIELLERNPSKRLSITDICNVADINRSTFYMHYEDVNQLVTEIEDDLLDCIPYPQNVSGTLSESEQYINLLEKTFDYIHENKKYFSIVFVHFENTNFQKRIAQTILERYKSIAISNNTLLTKYGFVFCINGVVGLIKEWIVDDFPISSRELAKIILQLCVKATDFRQIKLS